MFPTCKNSQKWVENQKSTDKHSSFRHISNNFSIDMPTTLDEQNNFMFPTCKNSQKRLKNQKSTDKHSSFDGLIQEDINLSDVY